MVRELNGIYKQTADKKRGTAFQSAVFLLLFPMQLHMVDTKSWISDIFRNAAAFLLCDGTHDGDEQLALAVEGVNVFFFRVNEKGHVSK